MEKKILIVGGTGFIGINLSKHCLKKKWCVTVLSRKRPKIKIKNIKYISADISKTEDLKKKIKLNYDYIINLGGNINHSNHKQTYLTHFKGLKNLIGIAQNIGVKKFIQIGSSLEYEKKKPPHSENMVIKEKRLKSYYSKSKFQSTKFLFQNQSKLKFNFIVLRLYQVYGPYQKFDRLIPFVIKSCLKNKKFPCSAGTQMRDFLHVNDVVRGIMLILKSKKAKREIINLGYGKPYKVIEIIKAIRDIIKSGRLDIGKISIRKDESMISYPNIKKVYKLVGWKPKIRLLNGLKYTINHYKKVLK